MMPQWPTHNGISLQRADDIGAGRDGDDGKRREEKIFVNTMLHGLIELNAFCLHAWNSNDTLPNPHIAAIAAELPGERTTG